MAHKTPEARAAYYKAYYERTKEHQRERSSKYGKEHRAERREYEAQWRANNPDKMREYLDRDLAKPKTEARKEYEREWKRKNYSRLKEWHREYYQKNQQAMREKSTDRNHEAKRLVLEHYGQACICCGESNPVVLTLDHANNDGARHRKTIGTNGGTAFYQWLVKNNFPNNPPLQVLCYNCNCARPKGACHPK